MADENELLLDVSTELWAICNRFNLELPLPPIDNVDQLAELIVARQQIKNDASGSPTWHEEIVENAKEILHDPQYGFAIDSVQSNSIPKRLGRMKFANMFSKRTGFRVRFQRIPHAAYFGLTPMIAGLLLLNQSIYPLIVLGIISIVAFTRIWMHFTSRDCTVAEFANLVICDNIDDRSNMTYSDILCYLRTKFPSGIAGLKSGG